MHASTRAVPAHVAARASTPASASTSTSTRRSPPRRLPAPPRAFFGSRGGVGGGAASSPPLTSADVVPGQGAGSPKWPELHAELNRMGVRAVDPDNLRAFAADPSVALVDVRQSLEFSEWRVPPSINCPYAIPDPNVLRRAVGFAISIKGGLKVRNPNFVEQCRDAVDGKKTVVLIDVKGGDLSVAPAREGSGVLDVTDSQALRAAYELSQAGFRDVRYARGGLPGAIDRGGMPYESEKWGAFLEWLDGVNPEQRKLLMYSRLLPDPTNLPGVVGQLAVFAFVGLAYYDVGGVGTWAAENVPAACSFLPVCL